MPQLKSYTVMLLLWVEAYSDTEAVERAKDDLRGTDATLLDASVVHCNGPVDND